MAQDIRKLFENEPKIGKDTMPKGHESRFLQKLDQELPIQSKNNRFSFLNIAASVVLLIGLSYGAFQVMNDSTSSDPEQTTVGTSKTQTEKESSLEKISPQLQKIEDYYLANINLELSKLKITPENKELFDGYLARMEELNKEYEVLSKELVDSGLTEETVNALIDNLKFRLNLMYRLKDKLNELNKESNKLDQTQA